MSRKKRIVLLCDGTWCGRETGTETNIYRLARLFDVQIDSPDTTGACFRPYSDPSLPPAHQPLNIRYRHGVGLGSSFCDYLFNGVTGQDLAEEVVACYRYIVEHYTPSHEIWLFGLSRGAYTVRCVAGLINNCGILRRQDRSADEMDMLCQEAYRIYRSRDKVNAPHSVQSERFRARMSWPLVGDGHGDADVEPPVRFMGIFDTVGALGIPSFTGGVGLEWRDEEFFDNAISQVVRDVCHLVSLHDRFYVFQPCLARRAPGTKRQGAAGRARKEGGEKHSTGKDGDVGASDHDGIDEEWIPGVHYDLGRQRFRFWRSGTSPSVSLLERLVYWASYVPVLGKGKTIEPNEVLADYALWKMLLRVKRYDDGGLLVGHKQMDRELGGLVAAMESAAGDAANGGTGALPRLLARRRKGAASVGSGDVYADVVEYGPFGSPIGKVITTLAGGLGMWKLFFELRDRLIPDDDARVAKFREIESTISTEESVGELGRVDDKRYPSRTERTWRLRAGGRKG